MRNMFKKHLGHACAEMTQRYQRRWDRFRINLKKAAMLEREAATQRCRINFADI